MNVWRQENTRFHKRKCAAVVFTLATLTGQTRIDYATQVRGPSVVLIQRAVCVQPIPAVTSDCSGMELYSLRFSDGSQKIMVGLPDDGSISKDAKWTPVPITPPGSTGTAITVKQIK